MPNAQVVASFTENGFACLAVRVGATEFIGRVSMDAAWQAMSAAEKKQALVAAVKQVRDATLAAAPADLGVSGQVAI